MQPPNLKSGKRDDRPWSCYDPDRPERAEYDLVQMPSAAMTAVTEGDMLETDDDPQPTGNYFYLTLTHSLLGFIRVVWLHSAPF